MPSSMLLVPGQFSWFKKSIFHTWISQCQDSVGKSYPGKVHDAGPKSVKKRSLFRHAVSGYDQCGIIQRKS